MFDGRIQVKHYSGSSLVCFLTSQLARYSALAGAHGTRELFLISRFPHTLSVSQNTQTHTEYSSSDSSSGGVKEEKKTQAKEMWKHSKKLFQLHFFFASLLFFSHCYFMILVFWAFFSYFNSICSHTRREER